MTTFAARQPVTMTVDDARRGRPGTRGSPPLPKARRRQCPTAMNTPILAVNCH